MNKPSKTRLKGIKTLAKRLDVTTDKAQQRQAIAIALTSAGKHKSKTKKINF